MSSRDSADVKRRGQREEKTKAFLIASLAPSVASLSDVVSDV